MSYPMEIAKVSLLHRGGTKEYFLTLVANANGNSIVIRRWGAKGTLGQMKVSKFDNIGTAEADFQKELKARQSGSKGYSVQDSKNVIANDANQLRLLIGRTVMPKMGADAMLHLDPSFDTAGMREPEQTREEDGTPINTARRVRLTPEQIEAAEREERERQAAPMRALPNFGRF